MTTSINFTLMTNLLLQYFYIATNWRLSMSTGMKLTLYDPIYFIVATESGTFLLSSKSVVLNLSSFEAHFQWPKNTWAHKTFTTNFEYHKMFFININNKVRLSIIKLILMSFYQLVQLHC